MGVLDGCPLAARGSGGFGVCQSSPLSVCQSVNLSLCPESVFWQMADWIQMPFRVVSGIGRGMGVILVGSGYCRRGRGSFWGEFGASHCNQWGLCCIVMRERRSLPKLLWGGLVTIMADRHRHLQVDINNRRQHLTSLTKNSNSKKHR